MGASAAAVFAIVTLGLQGACGLGGSRSSARWGSPSSCGWSPGAHGGYRIVLVGVGCAAFLSAVVQYLFTRANIYDAQAALVWLTGSLARANWALIGQLALALAVLLPAGRVARRVAAADRARRRHRDRARVRRRVAPTCCCCSPSCSSASAVAAAGPVSFAGFLAGPIATALNGGRTTLLGADAHRRRPSSPPRDYVGAYLDRRPQPARRRRHRRLRRTVPAVAARHRAHDKEHLMTDRPRPPSGTPRLVARDLTLGYDERVVVDGRQCRAPRTARSPSSSAPTPAASRPCCAGWPGCSSRAAARCCSTGSRSTAYPPRRSRARSACCPRTRSPPRA